MKPIRPLRIAMVVPQFPCFGEPYILSQMTGLIDLGQELDVIAINPSGETVVHDEVYRYKLDQSARYLRANDQYGKNMFQRLRNGFRTFGANLPKSPRATFASVNFVRHGRQAMRLAYLFRLAPFLDKQYDVVHCHFGPNARSFLFLKDIQHVAFVVSFHGYDFSRVIKEQGAGFYRDLFDQADLITANSGYAKGRLLAAGARDEKVVVLHESLPSAKFPFAERTLRAGEPLRILTIARLFEKKGYEYSVRAFAKVAAEIPSAEYWIVGDANGPAAPRIRELIRELGITEKVRILGSKTRAEVIEIIQQCHLFVLASVTASDGDEEGQGLVLQEAQASGMPVIASRHNGFPESLIDGETGYLVPERDSDALAEKILHLARHPELWPTMGRAGRQFVESKFDSRLLNEQLLGHYRTAQAKGGASRD